MVHEYLANLLRRDRTIIPKLFLRSILPFSEQTLEYWLFWARRRALFTITDRLNGLLTTFSQSGGAALGGAAISVGVMVLMMVAMMVMVVMVRFNIGRWDIKIIVHQMMFCAAFIVMHIVIQSYRCRCHVGVDVSKVLVGGE